MCESVASPGYRGWRKAGFWVRGLRSSISARPPATKVSDPGPL